MTNRQQTTLFIAVVYGLLAAACVGFGVVVVSHPPGSPLPKENVR